MINTKEVLRRCLRIIELLPIALPAGLAAFGVVATLLLLFGELKNAYVWPLGLIAALGASMVVWRFYPHEEATSSERYICNMLVLLGVLVWGGFNILYTAQHIITNRDPGTYANASIWLVNHANLHITNTNVFGAVQGVNGVSPGFVASAHGDYLVAQGLHLLPIFLGLAGRIVGIPHMLPLNVVFGMTALLAIYAFARLLARPFWAMVVTGALAASMPFIYFSRDTYTEPLAATFTFGGLTLLWLAIKSQKLSAWFVAGLVAGAGVLTRIDGFLTIAELVCFLGIMLALAPVGQRDRLGKMAAVCCGGMAVSGVVGWLDMSRLSPDYYQSLHSQFHQAMAAIAAAILVAVIAVGIAWYKPLLLHRADRMTREWRSAFGASALLGVAVLLVSRPLWYHGHDYLPGKAPQRNFAELSTAWVSWYIGPLLALLGVVGLALGIAYALRKRRDLLLASLLVIGGTALVYLVKPSIAPDQIWASRRLVPVILPGVAAFGAYALERLSTKYFAGLQWKYVFALLVGVALVLGPLMTSRPLIRERDTALLAPLNAVCAALPPHAAVLWLGTARSQLVQPTKGVCAAPSEGYGDFFTDTDAPSRGTLSEAAANARHNGYVPLVGLYGSEADGDLSGVNQQDFTTVTSYTSTQLDQPVTSPPQAVITVQRSILMGIIQGNGSIRPLRP